MKKAVFIAVGLLLVSGCADANKINKVQLGMTKPEVIKVMGQPFSTSAIKGREYLNYQLWDTDYNAQSGLPTNYYVRFVNGQVESYGRTGDFDSTKTPEIKIKREDTIQAQIDTSTKNTPDFYSELTKLKALKDEGAITEEEYVLQKKKILEKY